MGFTVVETTRLRRLITAAANVQSLADDGTLAEVFRENDATTTHKAVTAFDVLALQANLVANDLKDVSPFLRYRREILGESETAADLRALALCLYNGRPCNLSRLFWNADPHHTRIALECLTSYTSHGERDAHFMSLAAEISGRVIEIQEAA